MQYRFLYRCMGMMVCVLGMMSVSHADSFDHEHTELTNVLAVYVDTGKVDYATLKTNRNELDGYLDGLSKVSKKEFLRWSNDKQLAFLINLYNAETLQLIIDHYPVKSIKKIGGVFTKPWDIKSVKLFGEQVTLNTIEHDMIRTMFQDPRIHVALVCAAKGCPQLRGSAYTANQLNAELEEQAQLFLTDQGKNYFDASSNTLHLSPIFKWYKKDFHKDGSTVLNFIRDHSENDLIAQIDKTNVRIVYTDYDWSLNAQTTKR